MGQIMMLKRQCVCGEWDRVALIKGKAAYVPFYYVKCPGCGRQTSKHKKGGGRLPGMESHGGRE